MLGIVNYLINLIVIVDEVINNSGLYENLDVVICGFKLLNLSELILFEWLCIFIDEMWDMYDFIILDVLLVGLVVDVF